MVNRRCLRNVDARVLPCLIRNTPSGVAFYLDQAARAQHAGAKSAAAAMYRAAIEHVLFQQEYKRRMLGNKIQDLEATITDGAAPRWTRDLDPAFLRVIKKLGDGSIHPGEGDVSNQQALDAHLLNQLTITFAALLEHVYEREHEEKARLAAPEKALRELEAEPEER